MAIGTIKAWVLSLENGAVELGLPDMSSLDAVTRQLPQGYYSTFRTYGGGKRALGLRAHLQRMYKPAASGQIDPKLPVDRLREHLAQILRAYPDEARVRLMMSMDGQFTLALEPLKRIPPEIYANGVKVMTAAISRENPRLKSTNFISASQSARKIIAEKEVYEALLVRNKFILEGMTSNFFYIKDGKLGTARRDILLGVTRQTVLRVARGIGLQILYKPLKLDQVPDLQEAFLTSSSRGIIPIICIDDISVGEGVPGPMTKQLIKAYDEYVLEAAELI